MEPPASPDPGHDLPATASLEAALEGSPRSIALLNRLAAVYLKLKRFEEAGGLYRRVLALEPRDEPACLNLALALRSARQFGECEELLRGLAAEKPDQPFVHNQLGKLYVLKEDYGAALDHFQRAVALDPEDADSLYWIGGVKHALGDLVSAEADYARAARVTPLFRRPAKQSPPAFSVLLLCAPVAGNTPVVYLTDDSVYETKVLLLFADGTYDLDQLRQSGQILVNLVSDADQTQALLAKAAELVDSLGLPVINHPRKVLPTTRDGVARRLQGLRGCRVPRTLRLPAGAPLEAEVAFPILARPAGTHGGDDFEMIQGRAELAAFLARHPGADHYLIEFLDYASGDGFYRKFRFIFVEDRILQYHMAVGRNWKLHHSTTDMLNQAWMRDEEKAFLEDPGSVFGEEQIKVLHAIREAIGLDYFGIDCGLDTAGDVVVFEVNASMLVHPHNENFPYKIPHVREIKRAFDDMLARRRAE